MISNQMFLKILYPVGSIIALRALKAGLNLALVQKVLFHGALLRVSAPAFAAFERLFGTACRDDTNL